MDAERIEKAARALAEIAGDDWDTIHLNKREWAKTGGYCGNCYRLADEPMKIDYLSRARAALRAAYPELADGRSWIAPWEANDAIEGVLDDLMHYNSVMSIDECWPAMRDAALSAPEST